MRIGKLDDFKWIAAFLVVANHTSPLESLNETADFLLTRVLARVAVPFFFMVTGYFVLYVAMQEESGINRILASLKKTGLLYLAVTLFYLPVQFYRVLKEPVTPAALAGKILRDIFFDGTYYHLWYLPASMIGLLIAWLLLRYWKRGVMPVAILLYVVGLFGDSYYGIGVQIPFVKSMYEGMFRLFSYTRNGLLFAPLFLLLGYEMAVWRSKLQPDKREAGYALRNFFICLFFMCVEGLLLHSYDMQRHDSMYLILPICMVYLFRYLLIVPGKEKKKSSFYLKGPMLLYFVHPFVILLVRGFVKVTKLSFILTVSPVYYLAVLIGSLCIVYLWLWLRQYATKWQKRRNKRCI
ncbi:MAG: acyltransferase family protein [Lachnospiraceae bacterium]